MVASLKSGRVETLTEKDCLGVILLLGQVYLHTLYTVHFRCFDSDDYYDFSSDIVCIMSMKFLMLSSGSACTILLPRVSIPSIW